jgi:hypothetical protein
MIESGHHGSGLTIVPFKMDHSNALILVGQLLQDGISRIRAAVVHEDQFPRDSDLGQFAAYTLRKVNQRFSFIKNWNDDRDVDYFFKPWRPILEKLWQWSPIRSTS